MDFTIRAATLEDCKDISRMILVSRSARVSFVRLFLTILELKELEHWNTHLPRHRQHAQSFIILQPPLFNVWRAYNGISIDGRFTVSHIYLTLCNLTLSCRRAKWAAFEMLGNVQQPSPVSRDFCAFWMVDLNDVILMMMKIRSYRVRYNKQASVTSWIKCTSLLINKYIK